MDRDPSHIMQVGMGFWPSKAVLSAVELELFTHLGSDSITGEELRERLGLHERAVPDFPDTLVALGFLERDGEGPEACYRNTPDTAFFLDKNGPAYLGGILEMSNARLYGFWGDLTEALRSGQPQNEVKHNRKPMSPRSSPRTTRTCAARATTSPSSSRSRSGPSPRRGSRTA